MRFLRSVVGCRLVDLRQNEGLSKNLRVENIVKYQKQWLKDAERMDSKGPPRLLMGYPRRKIIKDF